MKSRKTPILQSVPLGTVPIVYTFRLPGKPYPCWTISLPNCTGSGYKNIFLLAPKAWHSKNGLPKKAHLMRAKAESLVDGIKSYVDIATELTK